MIRCNTTRRWGLSSTVLAPGALFGYDPAHRDSMRFNVAHSDEPRVQQVFEALLLEAVGGS